MCSLQRGNQEDVGNSRKIIEGEGTPEDIDRLESLAETITIGSLCGLGQTAANPVTSTLKYFRDEYEAHVYEKKDVLQVHVNPF